MRMRALSAKCGSLWRLVRTGRTAVRAALRVDTSTDAFFPDADGGLQTSNTRAIVEVLYLF